MLRFRFSRLHSHSFKRTIYLDSLSPQQTLAVTSPPEIPLQILAGPGSGKTRVLTSRIAHLIKAHNFDPHEICAVTFTRKAANEMKERLVHLLGGELAYDLTIGTFHSVCVRYLRNHADLINLPPTFKIAGDGDRRRALRNILVAFEDAIKTLPENEMKELSRTWGIIEKISTYKARETKPSDIVAVKKNEKIFVEIYRLHEEYLAKNDMLDFDDLLNRAVELFRKHPEVIDGIKHIFVDEFQDTNIVQYALSEQFAKRSAGITVVGDPDQSIYGWRSAEIGNLSEMLSSFPGCTQIFLEENYRSSGNILAAAKGVIAQDCTRINKDLWTKHDQGELVFLKEFSYDHQESRFIAREILRLKNSYGFEFEDFAILVRMNAQSRSLEEALQREDIPCDVLNGQKFFNRPEVKLVVSYLQLIVDENNEPAFCRTINTPRRGFGSKTMDEVLKLSKDTGISLIDSIRNTAMKFTTSTEEKAGQFLAGLDQIRTMARENTSVANLIDAVVKVFDLRSFWLSEDEAEKTDIESTMENIAELKSFASILTEKRNNSLKRLSAEEMESRMAGLGQGMLHSFLKRASPEELEDRMEEKSKVVISTVHQAKGLEWPVVFVPAVEEGTYPIFYTFGTSGVHEERRLLYVAMTRAKALLYTTHARKRFHNGLVMSRRPSRFLPEEYDTENAQPFSSVYPSITKDSRKTVAKILQRKQISTHKAISNLVKANIPMKVDDRYYFSRKGEGRPNQTKSAYSNNRSPRGPPPPMSLPAKPYKAKKIV